MRTPCTTCSRPVYVRPIKVGVYKKNYCSMNCRKDERVRWIGYIYANQPTSNTKTIAAYIGIPVATLRTWISRGNKDMPANHQIRFPKGPPKKAEHEKKPRKKYYVKKVKLPKPPKPPRIKKERKKKEIKPKVIRAKVPKHKPAKTVHRLPTKVRDESLYHWVRIDSKTLKQVLKTNQTA